MKPNDIVLLALKNKVTALTKADGRHLWATELPRSGLCASGGFVTLISDDTRVFAYCAGSVHCLDLGSGLVLWSNELPGYGYGLASLCLPGQQSAPDIATIRQHMAQTEAATSAVAATPVVVAAG
jgi:outer membrane protein assembly factor BamB